MSFPRPPPERLPAAVEITLALLAAFDVRDADTYVSYLADDVVVRPPAFIMGEQEQHGREEVRAAFTELEDALGPDREFHFRRRRFFVDRCDAAKVLVVVEIEMSLSHEAPFGTEAAMLVTLSGSEVSRIEPWPSEAEGLAQLEDPVLIEVLGGGGDVETEDEGVVKRMFVAIGEHDLEGALALIHPEVKWSPTVWSGPSVLRGRAAVRGWFNQFGSALEHLRIEVADLQEPGGWVIVCAVVHDTREAQFVTRVGWNFAVEDGLVAEGRAFASWDEALQAGGAAP